MAIGAWARTSAGTPTAARAVLEPCEALEGRRGLDEVANLAWRERDGRVHLRGERRLDAMDELPEPDFESGDLARPFWPEPI
ncbi:MAG: hypothetical protein Fur0037_22110 [Planctomycetota bacterium]